MGETTKYLTFDSISRLVAHHCNMISNLEMQLSISTSLSNFLCSKHLKLMGKQSSHFQSNTDVGTKTHLNTDHSYLKRWSLRFGSLKDYRKENKDAQTNSSLDHSQWNYFQWSTARLYSESSKQFLTSHRSSE